jgi:hypothetical protein
MYSYLVFHLHYDNLDHCSCLSVWISKDTSPASFHLSRLKKKLSPTRITLYAIELTPLIWSRQSLPTTFTWCFFWEVHTALSVFHLLVTYLAGLNDVICIIIDASASAGRARLQYQESTEILELGWYILWTVLSPCSCFIYFGPSLPEHSTWPDPSRRHSSILYTSLEYSVCYSVASLPSICMVSWVSLPSATLRRAAA